MRDQPPYWSLRDYKVSPTTWQDPGDCEHAWGEEQPGLQRDRQHLCCAVSSWSPGGVLLSQTEPQTGTITGRPLSEPVPDGRRPPI